MVIPILAVLLSAVPSVVNAEPAPTSGRAQDSLRTELEAIVAAAPGRAQLSSLGSLLQSRDLWLLTLSSDPAHADDRPGMLLVAGLDGTRASTTDVALRLARRMIESNTELLDAVTIYIVPNANPDAAEAFRALPSARGALTSRPIDEDRDGRIDEDAPRDLNGDGFITLMRQLDPRPGVGVPTLVADEKDPRILREPNRAKGEVPRYAVWIEGADADGDGLIAEDGLGGVDPDLNFPFRWPEFNLLAGAAPLSEPESMALARFVLEHPRLFAIQTLGRHDNVVKVPESRARDVSGGLPLVLDEKDAPMWEELAKSYREITGQSRAASSDPAGSFELWTSVHRGIPTVATTMWGRPDAKPETKEGEPTPAPGADGEKKAPADSAVSAPSAPAPSAPATSGPPAAGATAATGATPDGPPRGGRRRGAGPPASRTADAPAVKVDDPDAADWLAYSDKERGGTGFIAWTPFEHPTLGAVEIGGFVPGFRENPPPEALDEIATKQHEWLVKLAGMRPTLEVSGPVIKTLAPGLVQIDLSVVNTGVLPLSMAPGKGASMARPLVMRVTAPLDSVKSGRRVETRPALDPGARIDAQWIIQERAGEPFEVIVSHPIIGAWSVEVRDGVASAPSTQPGAFYAEAPIGLESADLLHGAPSAKPQAGSTARRELADPAWNRFYDMDEVSAMLKHFAEARPDLASLDSLGSSVEGRPMWRLTVTNFATGSAESKPAMYVDGSIHANEIQATETVLYSIWYLLKHHGSVPEITALLDRAAFYFVPVVSPDSRAAWFREPNTSSSHRTGRQPTDDDGDGLVDEDGPNDLDGDGSIGQMWRKDPFGTHRRNARDPRVLEPVSSEPRPDGTREYGEWSSAGQEGLDDDGDGRINEDSPGVYDMNRNWPSDWQPNSVQRGAGPWPLFYPETRSIGRFVLSHPNISAAQAFHNAGGMILRGPGAPYRENEYPRRDVAVYDAISRAGVEMLPFYRPLIIHSGLYTVHGGLVNWIAEGLGIVSFTNELWTDQRILQTGADPTPEQRQRWRDRVLFGQTFTDWTEIDHPDFGRVLVGGGTKFSSRIPPGFMLEEECHRNFAFVAFHAAQMPLLRWESIETKPLGGDLWQITVSVANDRLIPTRTSRAADKKIGQPDRLIIVPGAGVQVLTAGLMDSRHDRTFAPQAHTPERLVVEDGVPSNGSRLMRFIVKGSKGGTLSLRYEAEKAVNLERSVTLGADVP